MAKKQTEFNKLMEEMLKEMYKSGTEHPLLGQRPPPPTHRLFTQRQKDQVKTLFASPNAKALQEALKDLPPGYFRTRFRRKGLWRSYGPFARLVKIGKTPPFLYGFSWEVTKEGSMVCHPLGLNKLFALVRKVCHWMVIVAKPSKLDQAYHEGWKEALGYNDRNFWYYLKLKLEDTDPTCTKIVREILLYELEKMPDELTNKQLRALLIQKLEETKE